MTPPQKPTPLVPIVSVPSSTVMTPDNVNTFAGLRVVPARELTHDAICILIYSQGGVGKTTLAGMFSDYEPAQDVLIVDGEGGATAIANKDHIDVVQAGKWSDIDGVLKKFEQQATESKKYKTLVFDNLSEYQTINLATITNPAGSVGIQDWGRNTANMLSFTRRVRDLARFHGINVVMLAWSDSGEDQVSGKIRHGVALTNKLAARLPGIVNMVGYLTIEDNPPYYTRKLSFAASPRTDAKFRRASGDAASPIPLELWYGLHQNPIVDMMRTFYEGVPFPVSKYVKPKGRQQTTTTNGE